MIILTGDSFVLFELLENNQGKIVFWCNILAITDLQIAKSSKIITINFYEDLTNQDYKLKIIIDNIIIFRDTLVSRMHSFDIKVVSKMVDPLRKLKRRITSKDISRMKLSEIEENAKELKQKIEKGEIDNYTVSTFTTLCGKAIEELSKNNDDIKQMEYLKMMKNILQIEQVSKLNDKDKNINENNIQEDFQPKKDNKITENIIKENKVEEKIEEKKEEKIEEKKEEKIEEKKEEKNFVKDNNNITKEDSIQENKNISQEKDENIKSDIHEDKDKLVKEEKSNTNINIGKKIDLSQLLQATMNK